MSLQSYQHCRTLAGWVPSEVPSETDPEIKYTVLVNPWGSIEENICECKGYEFRGTCKHQYTAHNLLCKWDESNPLCEEQSVHQHKHMICPKCKGQTMWAFREDEE